ncbi:TetR family transcriptional regulator [Mucilaginibacter yixingensis]|uniref:TetR family transcriptional regulator n=1 Tax=Mucilaginibacter yixingensis TaxID=1295612 RepID=A0A2T5JGT3_9SPHI|nr:TetR/AcrR family transcriptional regulator [Mucilaginibacter yixingensis]PTR01635.1 TetR family transcriptional regulator [Mucilaginibacter yixingensis]
MGIVERRQRQKEEVRNEIIKAAWEMVKKDGWQSLSIRKIADAIEYSVPVIYDHFENKEAILLEFGRIGFNKLNTRLETAKAEHTDPAAQIRAMANAYWDFASAYTELYQLIFGTGVARCEGEECSAEFSRVYDIMIEPIETLMQQNGLTDVQPCLKFHTLWSFMHGLISIKLNGNSPVDPELDKLVWEDAITGYIRNLG